MTFSVYSTDTCSVPAVTLGADTATQQPDGSWTGTTYVSSACAAPCTASYTAATNTVSWTVGALAADSSVSVTFTVQINVPDPGLEGPLPETLIDNVGAISSAESPSTPSNVVHTVVPQVLPVVEVNPPPPPPPAVLGFHGMLPKTGLSIPLTWQIPAALVLIVAGCGLASLGAGRSMTEMICHPKGTKHPSMPPGSHL